MAALPQLKTLVMQLPSEKYSLLLLVTIYYERRKRLIFTRFLFPIAYTSQATSVLDPSPFSHTEMLLVGYILHCTLLNCHWSANELIRTKSICEVYKIKHSI